jgi:hypothetical protein
MQGTQSQAERAYDQVIEWLEHFEELEDPRQSGKVAYPLEEMLLQCLLAVLAGADSWVEIAEFGKKKLDFLRRFLAFEHGTPSHDQFGNLFAALDAEAFQNCFIAWVASLTRLAPDIIAVDGKTLSGAPISRAAAKRRSTCSRRGRAASGWSSVRGKSQTNRMRSRRSRNSSICSR